VVSASAAAASSTSKSLTPLSPGSIERKRISQPAQITGVRLAYNELTNLSGFVAAMELLLGPDACTQLTWLDLSHNRLTSIDEALLAFPNLTVLYLHGNQIACSLKELYKLGSLSHLSKLTLHGNPLYSSKQNHALSHPRSAIIYTLRHCPLRSLDFITITTADRRNAIRWSEQNKPKKKRSDAQAGAPAGR
jgi:Leucine-rich repeat (LRR) protein